jgi:hypothetical protein
MTEKGSCGKRLYSFGYAFSVAKAGQSIAWVTHYVNTDVGIDYRVKAFLSLGSLREPPRSLKRLLPPCRGNQSIEAGLGQNAIVAANPQGGILAGLLTR